MVAASTNLVGHWFSASKIAGEPSLHMTMAARRRSCIGLEIPWPAATESRRDRNAGVERFTNTEINILSWMSEQDREHWDRRYDEGGMAPLEIMGPQEFARSEALFPKTGRALELACGRGLAGVWLADRGLDYFGVDVSPVAIALARRLAGELSLADRCHFSVHDLDTGLPEGPQVGLLFCHKFRDARLDRPIIERLAPGGVLAIAVLSEVGVGAGPFRARPGELTRAFAQLEIMVAGEADGMAWLMGQKQG